MISPFSHSVRRNSLNASIETQADRNVAILNKESVNLSEDSYRKGLAAQLIAIITLEQREVAQLIQEDATDALTNLNHLGVPTAVKFARSQTHKPVRTRHGWLLTQNYVISKHPFVEGVALISDNDISQPALLCYRAFKSQGPSGQNYKDGLTILGTPTLDVFIPASEINVNDEFQTAHAKLNAIQSWHLLFADMTMNQDKII